MLLFWCCNQYASKFGKLSSGHRTRKGQFSFQSQRKAMPKNVQTTAQLYSSHMLVMFKILQARLPQSMNCELPNIHAEFRKGRGTRSNCQYPLSHQKSKSSSKTSISALLTAKAFDCVDHNKLWKILKDMGILDHLTSLLRNLYAVKKQQLELDMEQ